MIRVIIFDFFDVFRTDGFKRWLNKYGYEYSGAFLEASQKLDRGEYSLPQFFRALAAASGQTPEQLKRELNEKNELNTPLVEYLGTLHGKYKLGASF